MNIFDIIFSADFFIAILLHAVLIVIGMIIFEYLHNRYKNSFLDLMWEKLGMPLYRALVIAIFVLSTYPVIFGIKEAPDLSELLFIGEGRVIGIVNILFLISLLFPFIPFVGRHSGLVLPVQAIACCVMIFSWLADYYGLNNYTVIPDLSIIIAIIIISILTYSLAKWLAHEFGANLDKKFNLDGCQELIAPSAILFFQIPAILLYSFSLGEQLISVTT